MKEEHSPSSHLRARMVKNGERGGQETMLRIAIVEDNQQDAMHLSKCLERYAKEKDCEFFIKKYSDGIHLVDEKQLEFDLIFLDIEMNHLDGIDTARILRERDQLVCMIFVTNSAQYAIQSYEVNAFDYVMKPVRYPVFANKMRKAISYVDLHRNDSVWIGDKEGMARVSAFDIYSVQKDKNYLIYTTKEGEYRERGTLSDAEKKLPKKSFAKVNSGCLINLLYVSSMGKDTVRVRDTDYPVSRQQKKGFQEMLIDYIRDGVNS